MRLRNIALAGAIALAFGNAQAELFDRGGGLIYDDVLNVTWLQDANYAKTSGYDSDGKMNWGAANSWAANLVYDGYDDWRLPTALNQNGSGPCRGFNCTDSEMGHLFYTDGGLNSGQSIAKSAVLSNYFTNMQSDVYWSGTAYAPKPVDRVYMFYTGNGYQIDYPRGPTEFYAWAVRPGDVAAPIPEPEAYAMLLAGLGLLGVVARRRKQKLNA